MKTSDPYLKHVKALDARRQCIIPGEAPATVAFAVEHFVSIAEQAITARGGFYVALSGGSTPKSIYEQLKKPEVAKRIDWSRCHLFWSDERAVPPESPESNYHMAMEAAFSELQIPSNQIHRMVAENKIEQNALNYEALIRKLIPDTAFDLMMLGVGEDGHTASLFPYTNALHNDQHLVAGNFVAKLNTWRMTLTYPCLNDARHIAIYALGSNKAAIVKTVLKGAFVPEEYPVQRVGTVKYPALWIMDKEAAKELGSVPV